MKDFVFDISKHAAALGFFESAKIVTDENTTEIFAQDAAHNTNTTLVLNGTMNNPVAGLDGEVGLSNLGFLKGLCDMHRREDSNISVGSINRQGKDQSDHFVFADGSGNTDKYRFLPQELVSSIKTPKFKGSKWDVSFEPLKAKIAELSQRAGLYAGMDPLFTVRTEGNNLVAIFGSEAAGSGKMVLANGVNGTIKEGTYYPIDKFLAVMKLAADESCTIHFSANVAMITADSGIGVYSYVFPGMTK
jgi:hypothetical protein